MKIFAETERIILRGILPEDDQGLFLLDSDPNVHKFLGNNPVKTVEEARKTIQFIRRQYINNGIGRWAVVNKETNEFIGWSGLKFITEKTNNSINYYDLGYRFIKKYWGNGYATEAAEASLYYAFVTLGIKKVFAIADINNLASKSVLEKVGLEIIETFSYHGQDHYWFGIEEGIWNKKSRTANISLPHCGLK
jgi:RimJ/RimL family protein N-acetyltransferase